MIQHKLYNHITNLLSNKFCETWPDEAFSCASWKDIAVNIETIYRAQNEAKSQLPQHVRIGYLDDSIHSDLISIDGTPEELQIPLLFSWSSYRGLVLHGDDLDSDGDVAPLSVVNQIASCMLLRLLLQSEPCDIQIHKIDLKHFGKHLVYLPHQPGSSIITDKEHVNALLNELGNQIAQHPVDNMTWRCDVGDYSFAADFMPLQIVLISNWDDLFDIRNGVKELSEVQNRILDMLSSDIPARNGIYFFICGEKNNIQNQFRHLLPILAVDDCNDEGAADERGYCAQLYSHVSPDKKTSPGYSLKEKIYNCRFALPTENEIQTIQKTHRNYLSGSLSDTEGEGVWLGNSAKGLRAVMGVTPQGENQFFELGIGQAYDAFHALIGGATGSGKSVLLSEIVCSLAERYSPNELRMLLLDYKEGTEFAPFMKLPHVYALSVGANAEFGLEVLKEVQKEITRRGALFKTVNAKNLAEYRKLTGESMCRYVLVADEFQVLLGDKKYGEEAKTVLNDLVRRGRSFGFHAILATQTLRDGCLDGEAKNQFACRIAMRMAESETDYFLGSDNTAPATFNRKGQALVNYALGRKESNIIFQSGNKNMPKKFRDTPEVLECVASLRRKAESEGCVPTDVYVYSSDGFAQAPASCDATQGALVGLRNDMKGSPVYLNLRQLESKVLILGGTEKKRNIVLNRLSAQLAGIYHEPATVQTPAEYLDYPTTGKVTMLHVPEGDFDLEDAIADWREAGEQAAQHVAMTAAAPEATPQFTAPAGMEADFAELMQSMQANNTMLNASAPSAAPRRGRNCDTRCLVVAIGAAVDIKQLEATGLYVSDFRTVIYLDNVIYNQVSGEYESAALGEAAALLESPKGVVTKMRLISQLPV